MKTFGSEVCYAHELHLAVCDVLYEKSLTIDTTDYDTKTESVRYKEYC